MRSLSVLNPRRVLVSGDTHSLLPVAEQLVQRAQAHDCSAIVVSGDLETTDGGDTGFISYLNCLLQPLDIPLAYVDGNHDRHNFLRYRRQGRYDRPLQLRSHVLYAPRGLRWTWRGVRFLAAGGAYSIDRAGQERRGIYEPREILSEADVRRCLRARNPAADIIVAHDCPTEVNLAAQHQGKRKWTRGGCEDTAENRRKVSRVVAGSLPATGTPLLFHGHYHLSYETMATIEPSGTQLRVVGLGANAEPGSMRLLQLPGSGQYAVLPCP